MTDERKIALFDKAKEWIFSHLEYGDDFEYIKALKDIGFTNEEITAEGFRVPDSEEGFLSIAVGDVVVVTDEFSHDISQHILKVTSIEYDDEYITETNPKGMHCYGDDLHKEEWGNDYLSQITESNFCDFF